MRLRTASFALLAASFGALTAAAHADTVTYTFTGDSSLTGTNFTYVDTAGFLAFDTGKVTPTTFTDLTISSTDHGPITAFDFISSTDYMIFAGAFDAEVDFTGGSYAINAAVINENLAFGTLTITDTPSVSATPEPSSLMLLGTGVLGLAGAARRRFLGA